MVNKDYISKAFDEIISKHSDFLYNIEGTLREITDSKEEYKTLRDDIWKFWKETKGLDHEELIIKGDNGSYFENRDGSRSKVSISDDAINYLNNGGKLLYAIHNHPCSSVECDEESIKKHPSISLQSLGDFNCMSKYGIKYNISIGNDGLMISKNSDCDHTVRYHEYVTSAYKDWYDQVQDSFNNKYAKELSALKEKYGFDENKSYNELSEYHNAVNDLCREYYVENINGFISDLNNTFNERIYGNVDCKCFYVPRSPRIK